MAMKIAILKKADQKALGDVNRLLAQLQKGTSRRRGSLADLRAIVADKNVSMAVAKDGARIVGMGTLYVMIRMGKRAASIEDVVVDEKYRGQGLGKHIMRTLIAVARAKKVRQLSLTSRPARVAGNKLYQKLGFELKETNVYRLYL